MQGTQVWSLVWEVSTCHEAAKPMSHNHWVCTLKPASLSYWACALQILKPMHPRAGALQQDRLTQRRQNKSIYWYSWCNMWISCNKYLKSPPPLLWFPLSLFLSLICQDNPKDLSTRWGRVYSLFTCRNAFLSTSPICVCADTTDVRQRSKNILLVFLITQPIWLSG